MATEVKFDVVPRIWSPENPVQDVLTLAPLGKPQIVVMEIAIYSVPVFLTRIFIVLCVINAHVALSCQIIVVSNPVLFPHKLYTGKTYK
jgi:hypothetical protein